MLLLKPGRQSFPGWRRFSHERYRIDKGALSLVHRSAEAVAYLAACLVLPTNRRDTVIAIYSAAQRLARYCGLTR